MCCACAVHVTLRACAVHVTLHACVAVSVHAVVGEKEETNKTVNVRTRDNRVHGELQVEDLLQRLLCLRKSRANEDSEEFPK